MQGVLQAAPPVHAHDRQGCHCDPAGGTGQISDLDALNGDVGEIVRDFTEISRASGDEADSDESNEQAYTELVEFIRVAAQVVFEELLPLRRQVYPAQQRLH